MKKIKKRPFRKCSRGNHAVPASQTNGICDFMSLSNAIIHPEGNKVQGERSVNETIVATLRSDSGAKGVMPAIEMRQLEVINEICRRYVSYLAWIHEPCKSRPTTIAELAKKCERFNHAFYSLIEAEV